MYLLLFLLVQVTVQQRIFNPQPQFPLGGLYAEPLQLGALIPQEPRPATNGGFLSGLPPLPMTHEEVIRLLTTTPPPTTTQPTAKPTTTTAAPLQNPFSINPIPEIPPIPEERIGGTFDEDGNFVAKSSPRNNELKKKKSLARGAPNYQLNQGAQVSNLQIAPQFLPQADPQRFVRQPQYPPLIFRAKPQPANRDPIYNNLLLEIEEYDDFLDQVEQYKQQYPGAQVVNPYRDLPEGKLPAVSVYNLQFRK